MILGGRLINPNFLNQARGFAGKLQGYGISGLNTSSNFINRADQQVQKATGFLKRIAGYSTFLALTGNAIQHGNPDAARFNEPFQKVNNMFQQFNNKAQEAGRYSSHFNKSYQQFSNSILNGPPPLSMYDQLSQGVQHHQQHQQTL